MRRITVSEKRLHTVWFLVALIALVTVIGVIFALTKISTDYNTLESRFDAERADRDSLRESLTEQEQATAAQQKNAKRLAAQLRRLGERPVVDPGTIVIPDGFLSGLKGADGADGLPGKDGPPGEDGTDGADGADGVDGVNGVNGADGADGQDGQDGKDGETGPPGPPGPAGMECPPGYSARQVDVLAPGGSPGNPASQTIWACVEDG